MDTSLLQIILYVIFGLSALCMFVGISIVSFSSIQKRGELGIGIVLCGVLLMMISGVWAGFNNFMAFSPEVNAVMNKLSDCDSVQKRVNSKGYTNYVVIVDGKEYPVNIEVYASSGK